jgi:MFS family permease
MLVRRLLADPNLRILLGGQVLNMFGNTAMIIVLGIWVKTLTGSSGAAGMVFLLLAVSAVMAPLTGLLVDQLPRRRVLVVNDLASAGVVALLLLVNGSGEVWLIYLVALGYGLSGSVCRAARGGLVHSMVRSDLLGDANGLLSAIGQGLRIVGPLAGAALFAAAGGGAVAILDLVTFLASAGSFLLLRSVSALVPERGVRRHLVQELAAGGRHVLGTVLLRQMVLASAVAFTAAATIDVAVFALIDQGLHRPATFLGVLGAAQGAGSVVAGLLVPSLLRRLGEYGSAGAGFTLIGVGLGAAATATVPGAAAGALAVGLGLPMVVVAEITLIQRRTPAQLQGRAISASEAIIDIPFAAAIAVAAGITGFVGFRAIYEADAAVFLLVGLAMFTRHRQTLPEPEATASKPAGPESKAEPAGIEAATSPTAVAPDLGPLEASTTLDGAESPRPPVSPARQVEG